MAVLHGSVLLARSGSFTNKILRPELIAVGPADAFDENICEALFRGLLARISYIAKPMTARSPEGSVAKAT